MQGTRQTYYSEKARDEAYAEILEGVSGKRREVLECIISNYPVSDSTISRLTGIPVHLVCARRNELWGKEKDPKTNRYEINPKLQLIEFAGYDETVSPRQTLWKPVLKNIQPTLF